MIFLTYLVSTIRMHLIGPRVFPIILECLSSRHIFFHWSPRNSDDTRVIEANTNEFGLRLTLSTNVPLNCALLLDGSKEKKTTNLKDTQDKINWPEQTKRNGKDAHTTLLTNIQKYVRLKTVAVDKAMTKKYTHLAI